jgi:RNA polymerase sigma-70 factor (ECF subfamily)
VIPTDLASWYSEGTREQDTVDRGNMTVTNSVSRNSETKLVEKLRSGDGAAMAEFYNLYRNKLYSLVLEQVDRDETMAEDLVQEVFLAALSSLDKFRGDSQLYTWLRSIALHKINDFYRHQARQPRLRESSSDYDGLELEQARDNEPATHTVMEDKEVRESVHQALADLPHDYQEVLVLKYLKDMPVLAISQIMGRSPKSVEGLLSRARKAIRDNLGSNDNHKS